MRHHAIVVTSGIRELLDEAHEKATALGCVVTSIADSRVNGYRSFLIAPDGSKEGWEESEVGDAQREQWVKWAHSKAYDDKSNSLSFIEVMFADERKEIAIIHDSEELRRAAPPPSPGQKDK
jgi:hypothetical protein